MDEEVKKIIQTGIHDKIFKILEERKQTLTFENIKEIINEYLKKENLWDADYIFDILSKVFNDRKTRFYFVEQFLKTNYQYKAQRLDGIFQKMPLEERKEVLQYVLNSNVVFEERGWYIVDYFELVPFKDRTVELTNMVAEQADLIKNPPREKFFNNIPEQAKTTEFYNSMLKRIKAKIDITEKKDGSSEYGDLINEYKEIFKKIPQKAKTCEMLLDSYNIIDNDTFKDNLILMQDSMQTEEMYPKLFRQLFVGRTYFHVVEKLLNVIPKKVITEENCKYIFEGLKENYYEYKSYIVENLLDKLKKNISFSYDFYKEIVSIFYEENGTRIFDRIPKEYITDEMIYISVKTNLENPEALGNLLRKYFPKDEHYSTVYKKILEIVKNNVTDNERKALCYKKIDASIGTNVKGLDEIRNFADELAKDLFEDLKTCKDENGNILYTPKALSDFYNAFLHNHYRIIENKNKEFIKRTNEQNKIYEYFSQIIDLEKNNIENGIYNEQQTKIYETELYGEIDETKEKNPFWNLCAILNIMPDKIKDNNREKIYEIIKDSLANYDNLENEKVTKFLQEIMDTNEELFLTLDNDFFKTDKYLDLFGKEKYEILIAYPKIQDFISKMSETQLNMFAEFIEYTENSFESQKSTQLTDWVPIANSLILGMQNTSQFGNINNIMEQQNFAELSEEMKQKYLHIISKNKNWFDINTIEDLENYEETRKKVCFSILNGGNEKIPANIRRLSNREKMIFARLQLEFGLDIREAQNLVKKYGNGLNEEQKNTAIGKCLNRLKEILNVDDKNIEVLKEGIDDLAISQTDVVLMQVWEAKCRESYMNEYQKNVYKVKSEDLVSDVYEAEYDGEKIDVYESNQDFNMIIHSLGAYSKHGVREDYKKDWNMPKVVNHGLCTSYIGNNNLGTARVESVMYGFSEFTNEQLQLSSPWDIVSRYANEYFSISSVEYNYENGIWFCNPEEQINNTRHTHNEMVFERRQFQKNGKSKKMQPSYIVYMPEYYRGKGTEEILELIENREEEIKKYMQSDSKWGEAKKAATQFGIPIVIVDRAYIAFKQKQKIDGMIENFETQHDTRLIEKIICEFENNRTGNREYHDEICKGFFSDEILNNYISRIENEINNMPSQTQRKNAYAVLKNTFATEIEKRERFKKTDDDPISKMWKNLLIDASRNEQKAHSIKKMDIEEVIDNVGKSHGEITSQVEDILYEEIADMKKRNLYDGKNAHSDRHIQNVMLFALILGKEEKLSESDIKILLEAAKYHDSGRKSDNDRNHAEPSARIAGEDLKEQYDIEDLKIIQIAIEYHEAREAVKGQLDNNILNALFEKYEIGEMQKDRAKQISRIIKDADALDRTRFVNRAKLDVNYLHTEFAKSLKDFALQMNEQYAKNDIQDFYSIDGVSKEMLDSYIEDMKKEGMSNLELARNIRKNVIGQLRKSAKISIEELRQNSDGISQDEISQLQEEIIETNELNQKEENR